MRTIKIQIVGKSPVTDAPSVEDLLDQLRDYFDILRGVEEAIAEDGKTELDWRVIVASKNSPLALEAAAFPRTYATNVDRRAELVVVNTARGLNSLQISGDRPPYFDDKVLVKAQHFFTRVTNGLALTRVDYGSGLPIMTLDGGNAYAAAANVQGILKPPPKAYLETGSVEGIAHGFDRDGYNNPVLKVQAQGDG